MTAGRRLARAALCCARVHCPGAHTVIRIITGSCHCATDGKDEKHGRRRSAGCAAAETGKGGKMTLLGITTATLNVLHYKICDKTLLWGGLLMLRSHRTWCPLSGPFRLCVCLCVCVCVGGWGGAGVRWSQVGGQQLRLVVFVLTLVLVDLR